MRPTPEYALVVQLNPGWRVVDIHLQWVLERRKPDGKSPWKGDSFCASKRALLRTIRQRAGDVNETAMAMLGALPEIHR